jgi:hypothetical protein
MGICTGVAGTAFGSLDAWGLQLANANRAIRSRDEKPLGSGL